MDLLLYNGIIDTRDSKGSIVDAIGITNDKISFIGSYNEAKNANPKESINLNGAYLLPGFSDSHLHTLNYAFIESSYKMFGFTSISQIIQGAKEFLLTNKLKSGNWLFGRGWNQEQFTDHSRFLNKADLDEISTEKPVFFIRTCGHVAAANTVATNIILSLPKAKDLSEFIDEKSGLFYEAALKLVYDAMQPTPQEEVESLILLAAEKMNACGITAVQSDDFLSLPGRNPQTIINAYNALQCKNKLNIRVYEQSAFANYEDMTKFLNMGYRTGMGGDFYKIGPLKILADGSLGACTARLREPYCNSDKCGLWLHSEETFVKMVETAHKENMQIAVHTIGDGALQLFLDAVEEAQKKHPRTDCRHGAVHVQIADLPLLKRMKEQEIVAYIQPVFMEGDMDIVNRCVGDEREKSSYAWKTMLDLNIPTAGGSDAPVVSFNILENIQIAVTRQKLNGFPKNGWLPNEKITVDQAIDLFTKAPAYTSFSEDSRGTLEVGKYADITVLEKDLHNVPLNKIKEVKILQTIVGGKTVFKA